MNLTQRGLGAETDDFFTRLLEGLRADPGVEAVGAVLMRPLQGTIGWDTAYALTSQELAKREEELPVANFEVVTPGYFDALGTRLLQGRDFGDRDNSTVYTRRHRQPQPRDVFNAEALKLGATVEVRASGALATVVGIVADARYGRCRLRQDDIYVPYLQTSIPVRHLVIRGSLPTAQLVDLVREKTYRLDSTQPPAQEPETISEAIRRDTAADRFNMALVVAFGITALLLAAAGVYSVVSESVAERRREIAIRSALGASRAVLTRQLTLTALRFVLFGELVGPATIAASSPWLSTQLYGLEPTDLGVLLGVAAFLLTMSAAAAALPSWLAAGAETNSRTARELKARCFRPG